MNRCTDGERLRPVGLCGPLDGGFWGREYVAWWGWAMFALASGYDYYDDGGRTRCTDHDVVTCDAALAATLAPEPER